MFLVNFIVSNQMQSTNVDIDNNVIAPIASDTVIINLNNPLTLKTIPQHDKQPYSSPIILALFRINWKGVYF